MAGFADVLGHEQTILHMKHAIQMDKVSHAYIINGEKGSGKKLLAGLFAQTLQCQKKETEPCMECQSCRQAVSLNQPDIIRVTHEKANTISVEDIRTQVNGDIMVRPYSSPYKIYIIDEAEKLSAQAQNALLKTLEEPPVYGVILLLTSNTGMLLPTIRSRCVLLNLKPVPDEAVKTYLTEQMGVEKYRAEICTAFAQGHVGKAKRLAQSESFSEMLEHALHLVKYIQEMEVPELLADLKRIN